MRSSIIILLIGLSSCVRSQSLHISDGARDPRVAAYERRLFPTLGTCLKCGRPWNCCDGYSVMYDDVTGMFALCVDCWKDSSIPERKSYYTKCYRDQVRQGMKDDHLDAVMKAVEKESQPKCKP